MSTAWYAPPWPGRGWSRGYRAWPGRGYRGYGYRMLWWLQQTQPTVSQQQATPQATAMTPTAVAPAIGAWFSWRGWGRGRGKGFGRGGRGWSVGADPVAPAVAPVNLQPGQTVLERVPPGTRVRVVSILAGAGAAGRALQMGIAPGVELEVIDNNLAYPWTPILVRINGMTVAIGRGLAARIIVEPVGASKQEGSGSQA